jgi:hypothetical protein
MSATKEELDIDKDLDKLNSSTQPVITVLEVEAQQSSLAPLQ